MKKSILIILAGAAMAAACTKFAEDKQISFDTATAPSVTITTISDESVEVTIAAAEGTSFFAYAVIEGAAANADAETLLTGGYAKAAVAYGDGLASAVADYKKVQSVTMKIEGLTPYTEYTVYAVANTSMGSISEVATATSRTTDGTAPALTGYDYMEKDGAMIYAVEFSDPVSLTGNGTVTARFFALNTKPDETGLLKEYSNFEIPAEYLSAEGNYLYAMVPAANYLPGAFVFLTYTDGVVANAAGGKNVGYSNTIISADQKTKKGLLARYETISFDLSLTDPALDSGSEDGEGSMDGDEEDKELEPEYFGDWTKLMMTAYSAGEYNLAKTTSDSEVIIKAVDGNGRTVTYSASSYGIVSDDLVGAILNEDPGYGVSISMNIAEGSFEDIFGNYNSEFSAEDAWYCSYGYTLDDILGTYTVSCTNVFTGAQAQYPIIIEKSDNEENGNVMITNYMGIEGKLYCEFNGDAGYLYIWEYDIFSGSKEKGYCTYFNDAGDQKFLVEPGHITTSEFVCVMDVAGGKVTGFAKDGDGNSMAFKNFDAVRNN